MRGMGTVSYFCHRCLFRERIPGWVRGGWNSASTPLRRTSINAPCLENHLPQGGESPGELAEFGRPTLKKKPLLATSLADFVDRSPTLQKLMHMGVEIYKFDGQLKLAKFILGLDFEKDVVPYISFLQKQGVGDEVMAKYLTENPYILMCDLDDLQVRINYLMSKCFTKAMISTVITGNPKWLSIPIKRVDSTLGEIQKMLKLSGDNMRELVVKYPRVMNITREKLRLNIILFRDQMELPPVDLRNLFVDKPVLLARDPNDSMISLNYLLKEMGVALHLVLKQPEIIVCKAHFLASRHKFLAKLGRDQYDPRQPGYVSLQDFATMDDNSFCKYIAKTTVKVYYNFQKTF